MVDFHKLRKLEHIHIPLWLIKDTCWMMEWKVIAGIMIIPTVLVAIVIAVLTFRHEEFFINLAICFWISANVYWMCCEFMGHAELKYYAGIPFAIGIICSAIFYMKRLWIKDAQ